MLSDAKDGAFRAKEAPSDPTAFAGDSTRLRRRARLLGTMAIGTLVLLVALAVRLTYLEPIENDNDAIHKWLMVRQFLHGTPIGEWDHHAARIAINLPTYLVQLVFGTHPRGYYLLPVLMGTVQPLLVFLVARRTSGTAAGVLAAVLVTAFPEMQRAGSQLLPAVFSGTYLCLCVGALVCHEAKPRAGWLLVAGGALVLLYFTHLTNMYFLPGLMFAAWLPRRRILDVVVFLLPLGLSFIIETAAYTIFSDYTLGRYSVISTTHFKGTRPPLTVEKALTRFVNVQSHWQMLLYVAAPAAAGVLSFGRRRERLIVIIILSFVLFLIYPVRGSSRGIAISMHQRYLSPMVPLLMIVLAAFVRSVVVQGFLQLKHGFPRLRRLLSRFEPVFLGLALLLYGTWSVYSGRDKLEASHPLAEVGEYQRRFSQAFADGIPVVASRRHVKALNEVRFMYIEDELLLDDSGRLEIPPVRRSGRLAYVGTKTPREVRQAVRKRTCLIRLVREGTGLGARHLKIHTLEMNDACRAPSRSESGRPRGRRGQAR